MLRALQLFRAVMGLFFRLAWCLMGPVLPTAAWASDGTERSSLHWVRLPGAEACMNSQELAQAVEARLGRSVFVSASQGELAVQGHVRKESPGFLVTLTVSRADGSITGKRELGPSKDCRDLDEALVLVIALLLDPDVTTTDLDEEQTSEAEDASVVAMEPNAAARSWKPAVY